MSYVDSEYHLMGVGGGYWGRLHSVCIDCDGPLSLGETELAGLRGLEFDPARYGQRLFGLLFPPGSDLELGFRENLAFLRGKEEGLRLRLYVAPGVEPAVRDLVWERLDDGEQPLAASPGFAFSRYHAVRKPLGTALQGRPRLLVAISAPPDLPHHGLAPINLPEVRSALVACFQAHLDGRIEYELFDGPVTAGALQACLQAGTVHALHLIAHGLPPQHSGAGLVLQQANGLADMVPEDVVARLFLGNPALRLVTLISCHSGAPSELDPFHGLAGRLVRLGVPAVVAMRREISFAAAELFSQHLYRSLSATGAVDVAVGEGRHQLAVAKQEWDVPVLFLRLRDGRLWAPRPPWRRAGIALAVVVLCLAIGLAPWQAQRPSAAPSGPVPSGDSARPTAGESAMTMPGQPVKGTTSAAAPPAGLEEQLAAARGYCRAGGENLEQCFRAYRQILNGLPPKVLASLDQQKLALAEQAKSRREATDLYELVLSGLERSKPDTHSEP